MQVEPPIGPNPTLAVMSTAFSRAAAHALRSLLCLQAGSNWASGVRVSSSVVLTNAHLLRPFTVEGSNTVNVPVCIAEAYHQ